MTITKWLMLLLLLPSILLAEWQPIDFQKWKEDSVYQCRLGGEIVNYPEVVGEDTVWGVIDNTFLKTLPDSVYNHTDILKTSVGIKSGITKVTVTWGGVDYTITQKPIKLIWVNTSTWNYIDVTEEASWPNPKIGIDTVGWLNVIPGVNYSVHKTNATVGHRIWFKPAFLDSAVTLYNQRADSLEIGLGNVMEYTLSAGIDNHDIDIGDVPKRILKQLGDYTFELSEQYVQGFPEADSLALPVRQYWKQAGGKMYCVEYVMMKHLKLIHETHPTLAIWHNDVAKIEGTTNIEDAKITNSLQINNYGASTIMDHSSTSWRVLFRVKNIAASLGADATISDCACSLYYATVTDVGINSAHQLVKPWVEGNLDGANPTSAACTWQDWNADTKEWGTLGAGNWGADAADNSSDGSGYDVNNAASGLVSGNLTSGAGYKKYDVPNALAQAWYDGTRVQNGFLLTTSAGEGTFHSSENASNKPYCVFTYTAPAAGGGQVIIIGQKDE